MKVKLISLGILIMLFMASFQTQAQTSNFVGKWETTAPVPFYNNLVLRIKISDTDAPNYMIITNHDAPKKKKGAKYDNNKLYTNVRGQQIYLVYDPLTDMLEVFKINGASICHMTRFN